MTFKPSTKPLLIIFIFVVALTLLHIASNAYPAQVPSLHILPESNSQLSKAQHSFRSVIENHHSVVVITTSGFHKEIYGLLLWVLTRFSGLDIHFYNRPIPEVQAESTERFEEVIAPFWNSANDRDIDNFLADLKGDSTIRHVVMTTCSWDLAYFGEELQEIWTERADDEKFTIGCVRHWEHDLVDDRMAWFAEHDALGVMVLGDQLLETTLIGFEDHRRKDIQISSLTPIETLVPIFPMMIRRKGLQYRQDGHLDEVVIQSRWWGESRDLNKTYDDLFRYLEDDAKAWGYRKVDSIYQPIANHRNRFRLHLAGSDPAPYPPELEHVVKLHVDLPNPEFFAVLAAADALLPAFKDRTYIDDKVSSSIGVAGSVGVPILANEDMDKAYGYFCPASAELRPDGVSEIDYIAMVRNGSQEWLSRRRRKAGFSKCNAEWTAGNMVALAKVLRLVE